MLLFRVWMRLKSTIQLQLESTGTFPVRHTVPARVCLGLVLFALNHHRTEIVLALLVVGTVRSVTVWPILGLPAAAEGGLLGDVLDVDHVHHLGFGHANGLVNLGAGLWSGFRAERQVGHVDNATEGGGRWDQREPVLESQPEPSAEAVRDRQSGQIVGQGGLDQSG